MVNFKTDDDQDKLKKREQFAVTLRKEKKSKVM